MIDAGYRVTGNSYLCYTTASERNMQVSLVHFVKLLTSMNSVRFANKHVVRLLSTLTHPVHDRSNFIHIHPLMEGKLSCIALEF